MFIDRPALCALNTTPKQERAPRGPWLRLVSQVLALAGENAQFVSHAEREWSSSLFAGARHIVTLNFTGLCAILEGEDFLEKVTEHQFSIPRQIVADAMIKAVDHQALPVPCMRVDIEFLLIEQV